MAEPPKILQVTYGAFSCTLEGFEDPVEALIAVTEYFRGLEADSPILAGALRSPEADGLRRMMAEAATNGDAERPMDLDGLGAARRGGLPGGSGIGNRPGSLEQGSSNMVGAPAGRRRWPLDRSPDQDEAALQRILSRAETKLSEPEAQWRREAMAHLKAAVVATEAERARDEGAAGENPNPLGSPEDEVAPLQLEEAQRVDPPRMRAALTGTRPRAPSADGDIDGPPVTADPPVLGRAGAPTMLLRGTEVPDSAALDEGTDEPFRTFAAAVGAMILPDLLEAAAVWLARVGGPGEGTRAELAALAGQALRLEPPREEVLRVIGILLREGRLVRGSAGRFRAAPGSRFALR